MLRAYNDILQITKGFCCDLLLFFQTLDPHNYRIIDSHLLIRPTTVASGYKSGISNASMTKDAVPLPADLVCKIPHHNIFATYSIHIFGLFCGRVLHIHISLCVVKMIFVKIERHTEGWMLLAM